MKFFIFLLIPLIFAPKLRADETCPIIKTIVKAESLNHKKILNFCDLDDYYKLTFGNKEKPEIILYKKSHEVLLKMPLRGTELIIIDKNKRYIIRDNEVQAYLIEMDDEKSIIIFTDLDIKNDSYINRSYVLYDRDK